ncbi:MAG: LamG domain-containing protein [Caldilineaceae bacterium]
MPHRRAAGQQTLAFRFDGVDDVLTVDDINLAGTSVTVAVWAKRDAPGVNVEFLSQGSQGQETELEFGFRATNDVTCGFGGDNPNTTEVYPETGWHHWACTYDSATGQRAIYRDGVAVAVSAAAGAYTGSGTFFIGSQLGQTNYFAGLLDQVTVPRAGSVRGGQSLRLRPDRLAAGEPERQHVELRHPRR